WVAARALRGLPLPHTLPEDGAQGASPAGRGRWPWRRRRTLRAQLDDTCRARAGARPAGGQHVHGIGLSLPRMVARARGHDARGPRAGAFLLRLRVLRRVLLGTAGARERRARGSHRRADPDASTAGADGPRVRGVRPRCRGGGTSRGRRRRVLSPHWDRQPQAALRALGTGGVSDAALTQAYAYCHAVLRRSGSSFTQAFRLLGPDRRAALDAGYALCRFAAHVAPQLY